MMKNCSSIQEFGRNLRIGNYAFPINTTESTNIATKCLTDYSINNSSKNASYINYSL